MNAPIHIEHLTRSYGSHRGIIDVSLDVEPGEVFGFLGPNGAGKTTTIRLLMGLIRPTSGTARIFGLDCWNDAAAVKAKVGFLPGELHLYERMTGKEFLAFFAAFRPGDDPRRRIELANRLDLDLDQQVRHLSKGNRQKLAIVQALMHDAPLLILDEPSSGLDPLMQATLIDLLREERDRGKTIFLSSHIMTEVERVANRVGIIREGRLVAVEKVAHLSALRERRMEIMLDGPMAPEHFARIPGVRLISVDESGRHIELAVSGPIKPLLPLLNSAPVADITIGPPDLESVFLHYYEPSETRTHEPVGASA
jgi:ABC-2 type transport system ATP-binding protein